MATSFQPGFVWYPELTSYVVLDLRHCQGCCKLKALPKGHKYCGDCGARLLAPDPIDAAIAQMILEQENLLKRKYLRGQLSERAECR
jgi:hypothetical protein